MILELFSCAGGLALGARRAGLNIDMAFDWDADARASYEANLGHRPIGMDVRDLLRMVQAGWSPGPIDLLLGDPPCQPHSRAGKRTGFADERDMCPQTVELIRLLRPLTFLLSNVPGIDDAPNWPALQRMLLPLGAAGYCTADYAVLDAASFGVAQHRYRPWFFGHLAGPCIQWPAPTHGDPADLRTGHPTLPGVGVAPLKPWVTCRQALGHLPLAELGRPVRMRKRACNTTQHGSSADAPARVVGTCGLHDGNVLVRGKKAKPPASQRPMDADEPSRVVRAGLPQAGNAPLVLNDKHSPSSLSSPSKTILAKVRNNSGQALSLREPDPEDWGGGNLSGLDAVLLSEKAAMILQGLPEGFVIVGKTKTSRWGQIGMLMPVPFAEAVLRAVKEQMERTASQRRAAEVAIDEEASP